MDKLLSIVIPYYEEKEKDIFPLLSSINSQIGINFDLVEVILVNDGNQNTIADSFLELFFNLDITVHYMPENRGPGVARQYGLDRVKGQYVMFCDADDILHNVGVLGTFIQEIYQNKPNIITSPWLEELQDEDGNILYVTHNIDATWMHGKVFNTNYLRNYDIRFDDTLRVHEDSYFLGIAFDLTDNKRMLQNLVSYVWRWRKNSITRVNDAEYTFKCIPIFNEAVSKSYHVLERRGRESSLYYKVTQMIMYTYFTLHQRGWQMQDTYLKEAEKSFCERFKPFISYYLNIDQALAETIYKEESIKYNGIPMETLEQWLFRIGLLEEGD